MNTSELDRLREEYISYCRSHYLSRDDRKRDFDRIIHLPEVTGVNFVIHQDTLMFACSTLPVSVVHPDTKKTILVGEFVVLIARPPHTDCPTVCCFNISDPGPFSGPQDDAMHPHVNRAGELCLPEDREKLMLHVQHGRLFQAMELIILALWNYDPELAYSGFRDGDPIVTGIISTPKRESNYE